MTAQPPKYRLDRRDVAYLTAIAMTGWRGVGLDRDAARILRSHHPSPLARGTEHLPRAGGFLVVANHHQRPGMWIGWPGSVVAAAINAVQPQRTPVRIVVTDSQRTRLFGKERTIPFSRFFFGRIARAWDMIPIPADRENTAGQANALRAVLKALGAGQPVLFFPEGERGTAAGVIDALPGTGTFLVLCSRRAPIIPCAFWEEGAQLIAQFGPPLTLISRDDADVRKQAMTTIARMLPPHMRGAYAPFIEPG